jgi:hypothetical protein
MKSAASSGQSAVEFSRAPPRRPSLSGYLRLRSGFYAFFRGGLVLRNYSASISGVSDAVGCGSSLLFVFAGKLVGVAQYDLPLAVFTAVGLGAAQGPGLGLISGVTGHVL